MKTLASLFFDAVLLLSNGKEKNFVYDVGG